VGRRDHRCGGPRSRMTWLTAREKTPSSPGNRSR
jgi:hypothetical protein